jgi:16S rRNA processing protein RimM
MAEDIVIIGKITSAFGVKGGVKVFSFTQPRLNILNYNPWLLKIDGQWQPIELKSGREQGKTITAQLDGIKDRNQAETLSGVEIGVYASQLPEPSADEFYWRELEGMRVVNTEGVDFGVVSHLIETGSNDVLIVKETAEQSVGRARKERMIPFIADAIVAVSREQRLITVEWDADF